MRRTSKLNTYFYQWRNSDVIFRRLYMVGFTGKDKLLIECLGVTKAYEASLLINTQNTAVLSQFFTKQCRKCLIAM